MDVFLIHDSHCGAADRLSCRQGAVVHNDYGSCDDVREVLPEMYCLVYD